MPDADMDQTVDALIGAGYGSAGERCMAISVAVPVGKTTADRLMEKLIPRVESLKIGTSIDPSADYGPLVTREAVEKQETTSISASRKARRSPSTAAASRCRATRLLSRRLLFDNVTKDMRIYKEEIFGPVLGGARPRLQGALALPSDHDYGNGVAIFTRDGDAARDFAAKVNVGMVGINVPIPVPIAYYTFGGWKKSGFGDLQQAGFDPLLHQDQDDHLALAVRRQGRRGVLDPDDELTRHSRARDAVRSQRGPDRGSRHGAANSPRKNRAACAPLGRGEAFSGRRDARGAASASAASTSRTTSAAPP